VATVGRHIRGRRPDGRFSEGRVFASVPGDLKALQEEPSMSDVTTIEADVPERYADAVSARLRRAADEDVVGRLWRRDGTLWAPEGTPELTDRLGWLDIAERMRDQLGELESFAAELRSEGYTDAVVLGMGGSSLAPEVFRQSFGTPAHGLTLHVLDSTHPTQVRATLDALDLERALMIVSSKSGGTIEPMSLWEAFHARQADGSHYAAVTDPGSSLEQLAGEHGFRRVFHGDPDIGGRYSALSAFGLVPAAAAGIDLGAVLESATGAAEECRGVQGNAGLWLGCALGELALQGRDKLTFVADAPLSSYGLWAEQLVAESTGKRGRGILPIADEPQLDAAAYGDDRVFVHIALGDEANARHVAALREAGHPIVTIRALGPADLGRIFFLSEFAVAVAGWALELNPFDQPNVQEAKDNTNRVLKQGSAGLHEGSPSELADGLQAPHYFAIMGYLPYSGATDAAVARLRAKLIERHHVATTWGYGPRFLHSTGQFHKGGPKAGRFLQLVDEPAEDLEVPGEPFTFGSLIRAQADGDLQTLRDHGLAAVRVVVGDIDAIKEQL
jgi:transaldolase/glucose-6-phosphate isomerase